MARVGSSAGSRASAANQSRASRMGIRVTSTIERSPTVTPSTSGLSRAPWHVGHGRSAM